jgi:hypothetical protein
VYTVAARRPNLVRAAELNRRSSVVVVKSGERELGLGNGLDWPTLLKDYQAAVKNFESVSAALTSMLSAPYPLDADFLDLVTAEERLRETVILARMRLINRWRDSVEETNPMQILPPPDHTDAS